MTMGMMTKVQYNSIEMIMKVDGSACGRTGQLESSRDSLLQNCISMHREKKVVAIKGRIKGNPERRERGQIEKGWKDRTKKGRNDGMTESRKGRRMDRKKGGRGKEKEGGAGLGAGSCNKHGGC